MPHLVEDNLDDDEFVVREIRRSLLGLVPIIAVGSATVISLLFLVYAAAINSSSFSEILPVWFVYTALGLTIFLAIIITFIVVGVYRTNELVITNENLIQILQFSPFSTKVSRLNLAKVQDVSIDQNGIFAHLFNYGTIRVETAGEAANFVFRTIPRPNESARVLIEAHEDYVKMHPGSDGV